MSYIALVYTPGYMPMMEGEVFATAREAWQYLLEELEYYEEGEDVYAQIHNLDQDRPGTVIGDTPENDLGLVYSVDVVT